MAAILAITLGFALVTLVTLPLVVLRIPPDYLIRPEARVFESQGTAGRIALDVLGVTLVLIGLTLLVLPGQGVLTIVAGLLLLRFPGKRRLVRGLLDRPTVIRSVNGLRRRFGRPELRRSERVAR